jgi:hypothetical protein
MINKNITLVIFLLSIILVLPFMIGNTFAQTCSNVNVTLTNSSNFVCTSQWIRITNSIQLNNAILRSKGIIIDNTFRLTGNSLLNSSIIINHADFTLAANLSKGYIFRNEGNINLEKPIFLNFTNFFNNGSIYDKNYMNNGGTSTSYYLGVKNFPESYAGSGAGSISNESASNGGGTLAAPGSGYVLCNKDGCGNGGGELNTAIPNISGNHVSYLPLNYTFNLSLLESAGGADFNGPYNNLINGGSGVFPLIIISKEFSNKGTITNRGQSINYSKIPNGKLALEGGVVGAGGGGILEIIAGKIENNGTMNVSGGKIYISPQMNSSLSMVYPDVYNLSYLGNGGEGNILEFKAGGNLLVESLPAGNNSIPLGNSDNITEGNNYGSGNQTLSSKANATVYSFKALLANDYGCSTKNIYIKVSNPNSSAITQNTQLGDNLTIITNSSKAQLELYGKNPILNYYNKKINVNLSNTSYYFKSLSDITLNLFVQKDNNLSITLANKSKQVIASNVSQYSLKLPVGRYNITLYNATNRYVYTIYLSQNCLGYENISLEPGKPYYYYDGLNISNYKAIFSIYKTKIINYTAKNVYYNTEVNQLQNLSQLTKMDSEILKYITSMNESISKLSHLQNYSSFVDNLNSALLKTAKPSDNQAVMSINESGFDSYYYKTGSNETENKLVMYGNSGMINISYGNKSLKLLISKKNSPSVFTTFESTFVRAIEYVPTTFMGLLGGI